MKEECHLKGCKNLIGPGAANVGYTIKGVTRNLKACSEHTWMIMTAPRGTWFITEDRELIGAPASPTVII